MRISERVNITCSPCDICWHVHKANAFRRLDSSRFANLDLWIPRVLQEWRQPAELELGATVNQRIGVAQSDHKAWSRIDEVRILSGFRQHSYVDFIATDFACERAEVRQRRDDVQAGLRCESG